MKRTPPRRRRAQTGTLVALTVALLAVDVSAAQLPAPPVHAGDELAARFVGSLRGSHLRRWEQPQVTFAFVGAHSPADRAVVAATLDHLGDLTGVPDLVLVDHHGDADVRIHVAPKDQWAAALGELWFGYDITWLSGLTSARAHRGVMRTAGIVADAAADQPRRNRILAHELLHALGLAHHDCVSALLYGGPDKAPEWEPAALDRGLVELTYNPGLRTGDNAEAVARRIIIDHGDGPRCAPLRWQLRSVGDGATLWCEAGGDVSACQQPRSDQGPSATAPPVGWVHQQRLYRYDPRRYIVYRYDNQRLLCERPVAGRRGACELTDRNQVEHPDWWTDGHGLFATP